MEYPLNLEFLYLRILQCQHGNSKFSRGQQVIVVRVELFEVFFEGLAVQMLVEDSDDYLETLVSPLELVHFLSFGTYTD